MNIAFVGPEFFPFVNFTGKGQQAACLVEELASLGHDVCVVIPFPEGENLDSYSLARRLVPITVEVDGKPVKSIRYDGRSPSGIPVHLLGFEQFEQESKKGEWPAARVEAFGKAAAAVLGSMNEQVDTCISCGVEASCVSAVLTGDKGSRPKHVLALSECGDSLDVVERGIGSTDRVIFMDGGVQANLEDKGLKTLTKMLENGEAVTLKRPGLCDGEPAKVDKSSQKTALQMKTGLPVRKDAPLVCFPNCNDSPYFEALESLLKRDVQVVAAKSKQDLSVLTERYGDRLALVSEDELLEVGLDAGDVCVAGDDGELAARAMSRGCLPIVGPALGQDFVDLEPSCQTGSAIVLSELSSKAFDDGFGRLLAAFVARADFYKLLDRIPGFAPSWKTTANHYLQVVESIELR